MACSRLQIDAVAPTPSASTSTVPAEPGLAPEQAGAAPGILGEACARRFPPAARHLLLYPGWCCRSRRGQQGVRLLERVRDARALPQIHRRYAESSASTSRSTRDCWQSERRPRSAGLSQDIIALYASINRAIAALRRAHSRLSCSESAWRRILDMTHLECQDEVRTWQEPDRPK